MKDSVRTAALLGGAGALCGGCISLAYLGLSALAATVGAWAFLGLLAAVPVALLAGAAVYLRWRRTETCDLPAAEDGR